MVRKRKSKRKSKAKKKTKTTRTKKRSDLDVLKEQANQLYPRVQDNLKVILTQTGITREELAEVIQKYGYDAVPTLDGFNISEPIWNQMVKIFKLYDKVAALVERLDAAHNKLFIDQLEKKTVDLEAQVKKIEEEEAFYTKLPDKEGMVKMKEKWYAEKEHWEFKKAEAIEKLQKDPEHSEAKALLAQAELQLKILNKKRWWARGRNIMPTVTKYMGKISRGINETSKGLGEIGDQFSAVGKEAGVGSTKQTKSNDWGFSPENVFGTGGGKKGKKYSWDSGF